MVGRHPDGAALLVAGYGALGGGALEASAVHTLGQIGEALLATGGTWQIRRLAASAGERVMATRGVLKHHLDELTTERVRVAVLVILGEIVEVNGEHALVTGPEAREYPEDATLPLRWIRDRLRGAKAEHAVVVLAAHGSGDHAAWLAAMATRRREQVIAVEPSGDQGRVVDALLAGLCGEALDARTGTVTMASLSTYLQERAKQAVLQPSEASETIAQPPPLAGFWDVRRSQLSNRAPRARRPDEPEDLTGAVLPGRFRIDRLVARGTFGTVYRARQLAVERDVAVKVLHANIDPSSDDGRLFVHEIRSVGRIDHANVVRIHQADITHDGRLFFAMELLDGTDLQTLATEGVLPRVRAVELVRQLLLGLDAAHDAGLVHADVKPANAIVMPREDGERLVLVDFGLSRLRSPDRPAESAGGTPAYMAPEQLHEGRVDARSDIYSAALILVYLLTKWRRPNAFSLSPPREVLDTVDEDLRAVITRALSPEPAKRYQHASEVIAALSGQAAPTAPAEPPPRSVPFQHLASLTEVDRERLHGREADLAVLTEHALYRRVVIYTAPSGTGKTSMLRAGLVPRLESLGVRTVYLRCRADSAGELARMIDPAATTIADAITRWHAQSRRKLVLILDQLETALADGDHGDLIREVLAFERWPASAEVAIVLSIREDYLARLIARSQALEPGIPLVRLPPLDVPGARDAICGPLMQSRLAIEPELLDVLLADLQRAAAAIGPEMGWGTGPAVYPPHLQLACSALYDALGPGEATLTVGHYRALGGFDAIVGEHLERVLDTELAGGRDRIARDLFLALVTAANQRAMRTESELVEIVGAHHARKDILEVLEMLRTRGLLVRIRDLGGEPGWELVHDSLVPRVLAWIDRRDLARRRAIELVRYHLRRSQPAAPSLLGRAELRELKPYADAIDELEAEWQKRGAPAESWTPARLVARSRAAIRRRATTLGMLVLALLAMASIGMYRTHEQEARAAAESSLRARDLGRMKLSLTMFDWDYGAQKATPVPVTSPDELHWELHVPDPDDPAAPGGPLAPELAVRGTPSVVAGALVEHVEAHGGAAVLVVHRTGCGPSIVPLHQLPGYAQRGSERVLVIRVPTCRVSRGGMVTVPAGPFLFGGEGIPVAASVHEEPTSPPERQLDLPTFQIDRTEVSNGAYDMFGGLAPYTGIQPPVYPETRSLVDAGAPTKPVASIDWKEARAFCRYWGKVLPTTEQWTKAMRGGLRLPDGSENPAPHRNFPWGTTELRDVAIADPSRPPVPADVGAHVHDVSPYGVLDLAGNVSEWTATVYPGEAGIRVVRGGDWDDTDPSVFADFMAIDNPRPMVVRSYAIGVRCASD